MIEIAPEQYWITCTFKEAKLYLQFLEIEGKIGWKLPTAYHYNRHFLEGLQGDFWWDSSWDGFVGEKLCIPVRKIDD